MSIIWKLFPPLSNFYWLLQKKNGNGYSVQYNIISSRIKSVKVNNILENTQWPLLHWANKLGIVKGWKFKSLSMENWTKVLVKGKSTGEVFVGWFAGDEATPCWAQMFQELQRIVTCVRKYSSLWIKENTMNCGRKYGELAVGGIGWIKSIERRKGRY